MEFINQLIDYPINCATLNAQGYNHKLGQVRLWVKSAIYYGSYDPFSMSFAKCLFPGEDGPWQGHYVILTGF